MGARPDEIAATHRDAGAAPGVGLNEQGGCAVDWSWLAGRQIARVANGLDELTLAFADGGTFTVRALLWEGKPFLAFAPLGPE
jgi:hypothetical protein